MFECKLCQKKFKSARALGGHMSSAHSKDQIVVPAQNGNPVPAQASETDQEDEGTGIEIRSYLGQGYNFEELTKRFSFSPRSVRREMEKFVRPASEQDNHLPVTYKQSEVINPEAVLRRYTDGSYEDEIELRGMMKLRAAMLMVMDLVNIQKGEAEADARRVEPILKMMKEGREEMDAAARRAKDSSMEIADKAAYETANQLSQVIAQNNARITDSINQIRQAMGGKEENPLGQVLNSMQSLQQMMGMFGVSMPGMAGQAPGGGPVEQWQPPPITHRKRDESQGGEENV
ncbi:MAG: C2H2-type zinc finger protein [Dehalococcoidia bacterium]|nr:C2H2-type zinc finger protein [Dehalococcoidia bacterium]